MWFLVFLETLILFRITYDEHGKHTLIAPTQAFLGS